MWRRFFACFLYDSSPDSVQDNSDFDISMKSNLHDLLIAGFTVLIGLAAIAVHANEWPPFMQALPIAEKVFDAVIDDVDDNGRLDVVLTLRKDEIALVAYQKEPRRFELGSSSKITGFHADRLTLLPTPPHRYLLSAEGENLLKVLGSDGQGGLKEISSYSQPAPFTATAFRWPDWGLSLAVSPYADDIVSLIRNFNVETGEAETAYSAGVENHTVPGEITVADLDGDGIDELLYTTRRTRTIWRINYPQGDKKPESVKVWTTPKGHPRHVAVADLNGDGALDIVMPLQGKIGVLLNNGKGEFTEGPELPFSTRFFGPAHIAINTERDGASLVVGRSEQSLVFVRVEKNAAMNSAAVELPLNAPWGQVLLLRDIDGDGETDLLVSTGEISNSLRIIYGPLWSHVKNWTQQQAQLQSQGQPKPEGASEPKQEGK